jgi:hypothetical protein
MRLMPGTDWNQRSAAVVSSAPQSTPALAEPADPRVARIDAACARIEAELAQASPQMRELLGAQAQTAVALRETCRRLLEREKLLRAESSPEGQNFLEHEKSTLRQRIEASSDVSVKRSLESAIAAIDEQLRQRGLLRQSADRLDAELTRLSWTLDGMGTQLVRLRTAGQEAAGTPDAAALRSMEQLSQEVDAIAEALEQVARDDQLSPVVDITGGGAGMPGRARERS